MNAKFVVLRNIQKEIHFRKPGGIFLPSWLLSWNSLINSFFSLQAENENDNSHTGGQVSF